MVTHQSPPEAPDDLDHLMIKGPQLWIGGWGMNNDTKCEDVDPDEEVIWSWRVWATFRFLAAKNQDYNKTPLTPSVERLPVLHLS